MPYLLSKKKVGNNYSIYRRNYEYDTGLKNTKVISEKYLGRYIESFDDKYLFYNNKIIKNQSLTYFLNQNRDIYTGLIDKYIEENKHSSNDKLNKLLQFPLFKEDNLFLNNDVLWKKSFKGNYIEYDKFTYWLNDFAVTSIDIFNNDKKRNNEIRFLEYINENVLLNINRGTFKNYIIILDNKDSKLKSVHDGIQLNIGDIKKYFYSDLDIEKNSVINLINELFLIKNIIIHIDKLREIKIESKSTFIPLRERNKKLFGYVESDINRIQYLLNFSLFVNQYFMKYVDRVAYKNVLSNPF